MTTITAYKVTTTKAYMADECGTGYSLTPWGRNTAYYEGYDEPVTVELADDCEVVDHDGIPMISRQGDDCVMYLREAILMGYAKVVGHE